MANGQPANKEKLFVLCHHSVLGERERRRRSGSSRKKHKSEHSVIYNDSCMSLHHCWLPSHFYFPFIILRSIFGNDEILKYTFVLCCATESRGARRTKAKKVLFLTFRKRNIFLFFYRILLMNICKLSGTRIMYAFAGS